MIFRRPITRVPGNIRESYPYFIGDMRRCFTKDLKVPDHCIFGLFIGIIYIKREIGTVLLDTLDSLKHIFQYHDGITQ